MLRILAKRIFLTPTLFFPPTIAQYFISSFFCSSFRKSFVLCQIIFLIFIVPINILRLRNKNRSIAIFDLLLVCDQFFSILIFCSLFIFLSTFNLIVVFIHRLLFFYFILPALKYSVHSYFPSQSFNSIGISGSLSSRSPSQCSCSDKHPFVAHFVRQWNILHPFLRSCVFFRYCSRMVLNIRA